ncbi:MAG: hypothetical protein ACREMN_07395 [Gemmatimonadales bacterium]
MTHLAVAILQHGESEHTDFIYFLSSLLIVALPVTVFSVLAYLLVKKYWKSGERRP